MTTRAQLESEREALQRLLACNIYLGEGGRAALTASIARIDALLSLSDDDVRLTVQSINQTLAECAAAGTVDMGTRVLPVLADLVRRS